MVQHRAALLLSAAALTLVAACAPASEGQDPRSNGQSPPIRKTLRLGSAREPIAGIAVFAGGGEALQRHTWIFHAGLTAYDADYNLQPRLASKVPSLADGDWIVLPDGGMELTWKLRPNLKWHDGTPLSAEDFVLGIEIARDPALPVVASGGIALVKEAVAMDAVTLVVRWSAPYFGANVGTPAEFPAVPHHIVGDLYRQGDKDAVVNNPYWATEFVGLGPYKLREWALGSYTEGLAFDDYVLGRPKIDRVVVRYFGGDVTTIAGAKVIAPLDPQPCRNASEDAVGCIKLPPGPKCDPNTQDCSQFFDNLPEIEVFDRTLGGKWLRLPRFTAGAGSELKDPARYDDPGSATVLVRFVNDKIDGVGFGFQVRLEGDVQ